MGVLRQAGVLGRALGRDLGAGRDLEVGMGLGAGVGLVAGRSLGVGGSLRAQLGCSDGGPGQALTNPPVQPTFSGKNRPMSHKKCSSLSTWSGKNFRTSR